MMKAKLWLMPKEPTWWVWLVIVSWIIAGLAGVSWAFMVALALSAAQAIIFFVRHRSLAPYPVQIRVAYTALLGVCLLPAMRWLFWLPAVGTCALLLFGYCLMARMLSLLPWNRREPLSAGLVRRTFFTPPMLGRADHGLPALANCPGGVCELEARAASLRF